MIPPTIAEQRGLAIAPIPFAVISFISSSYVIYYLICKERHKLKRLYHRLVLSMNFALLPVSFVYAWSTLAVPVGTPYYYGASGNVNTCTAQGFIFMMFSLAVPAYYGSLSLQAFVGIRNNFEEDRYRWVEKYIHLAAYCIPITFATIYAATQNFNPNGSGCSVSKYPRGCDADPDVQCERGQDIDMLTHIVGFILAFLYFIFPPSMMIGVQCWIRNLKANIRGRLGMQQIREAARNQLMRSVARQIYLYLFSFWFTFLPTSAIFIYQALTDGELLYPLMILANCAFACQGFVMALVYFMMQRLGKPMVAIQDSSSLRPGLKRGVTVKDIRASALRKAETGYTTEKRVGYNFNIFDGVPDADSPWARFIDEEESSGEADTPDESESSHRNKAVEQV